MTVPLVGRLSRAVGNGVGVGVGVGLTLVAASALRGGDLRPVLRGFVKGGLAVADCAGRVVAQAREAAEDLLAEAHAEREVEQVARDAAADGDGGDGSGETVLVSRRA